MDYRTAFQQYEFALTVLQQYTTDAQKLAMYNDSIAERSDDVRRDIFNNHIHLEYGIDSIETLNKKIMRILITAY